MNDIESKHCAIAARKLQLHKTVISLCVGGGSCRIVDIKSALGWSVMKILNVARHTGGVLTFFDDENVRHFTVDRRIIK